MHDAQSHSTHPLASSILQFEGKSAQNEALDQVKQTTYNPWSIESYWDKAMHTIEWIATSARWTLHDSYFSRYLFALKYWQLPVGVAWIARKPNKAKRMILNRATQSEPASQIWILKWRHTLLWWLLWAESQHRLNTKYTLFPLLMALILMMLFDQRQSTREAPVTVDGERFLLKFEKFHSFINPFVSSNDWDWKLHLCDFPESSYSSLFVCSSMRCFEWAEQIIFLQSTQFGSRTT